MRAHPWVHIAAWRSNAHWISTAITQVWDRHHRINSNDTSEFVAQPPVHSSKKKKKHFKRGSTNRLKPQSYDCVAPASRSPACRCQSDQGRRQRGRSQHLPRGCLQQFLTSVRKMHHLPVHFLITYHHHHWRWQWHLQTSRQKYRPPGSALVCSYLPRAILRRRSRFPSLQPVFLIIKTAFCTQAGGVICFLL